MREHKQNWLDVFTSFRIALDARKIILGTLGVYVSIIVLLGLLSLAAYWCPGAKMACEDIIQRPVQGSMALCQKVLSCVAPAGMMDAPGPCREMASNCCPMTACRFQSQCAPAIRNIAFIAGGGIIMLFIWAFFGGAIARIAAVDLAKGERPEIGEATSFAARKFGAFFWSPVVPFIFVLALMLCNILLGVVGRIPWAGPVLMGLFFILAMVSAFFIVILLIGTLGGFPFMWPTIAMEGTDAFDAISRSFNYLFARPWKCLWCWLMAAVYGFITTAFVVAVVTAMLWLALKGVALGMGSAKFMDFNVFLTTGVVPLGSKDPTAIVGMLLLRVVIIMSWGLVLGYIVSYKISAWTVVYGILRRDVDGTDMSEAYMPEPEDTPAVPGAEPKAEAVVPPTADSSSEQKPAQ